MRQPRIVVNLVFFALLGIVLAVWAVRSIVRVEALERPFPVTADFASSPGLYGGLEVTHLGVRVGQVSSVRLSGDHVAVSLDMDRDVRVPADVGARVLRKSAIGEPYIDLTAATTRGGAGRTLRAGDHIPLSRTAGTTDYKRLFEGLSRTLEAVDPRDGATVVHELATGLEGRGPALNDMIADTGRLTRTLAADAENLDALAEQLTRLTATLTDHRHQIASGINDLAVFSASLRRSRNDLDSLLDHGPGALSDLDRLLQTARPGLDCLLSAAATPTAPLLTPANRAKITHVLRLVPTLQALVADITARDASGSYLRVTPVISIAGPARAPIEYTSPVPKPVSPSLTLCDARGPVKTAASAPAKPNAGTATPRPGTSAHGETRPLGQAAGNDSASPTPEAERPFAPSRWLPLLPPVLAGFVVVAVCLNTLRVLRRRLSR
ncbi:MCE family protein [Spirillospora sp. NPDC047279]|uniref:MCE family protein n=1 Tax=Spirillospora sp. NPDC047279 TaxID=3155478 RepID=UPI0033F971DF